MSELREEIVGLIDRVGGVGALLDAVREVEGGGDEEKKKLSIYVPRSLYDQVRAHSYLAGGGLSEVGVQALRLYVRVVILGQTLTGFHRKRGEVITKPVGASWPALDSVRLKSGRTAR